MTTNCPFTGIISNVLDNSGNILKHKLSNNVMGVYSFANTIAIFSPKDKYNNIRHIITGILRHHWEKYKTPFEITHGFLNGGYNDYDYPCNFKEKSYYFLKYLYENGGSDYKTFTVSPSDDYSLSYSVDTDEFIRLLDKLDDEEWITHSDPIETASGEIVRVDIKLTKFGIKEIEKELPEFPMFGLAKQDVYTGDEKTDLLIAHARKLFFKYDSTEEDKRSACEALHKVLEPIREELKAKKLFGYKDVDAFFKIVNKFDIRHNKEYTKQLIHIEQLEWVYFTLLNSIICFFKLNSRSN